MLGDLAPVELIDLDRTAVGDRRRQAGPRSLRRSVAVAVLAIAGVAVVSNITGEDADEATDPLSAPAEEAQATPPLVEEAQGSVRPSLENGHGEQLAVVRAGEISLIDLATGQEAATGLGEPGRKVDLASADGHLIYVVRGQAWMVSLDGSRVLDLGPADTVIEGSAPSLVWVGQHIENDRTNWREIDSDGNQLRSAITAIPLDFDQPDLRWGHQNQMLLLSDSESRPWQVVGQGFPLAVGPNDLILTSCDVDLLCDRFWFDLRSAEDRGPLLADVADNIGEGPGGVISPTARYMVSEDPAELGVTLLALSDGQEIDNNCSDASTIRWSRGDTLLACFTKEGIVVHDLESNTEMRIDRREAQELAFVFVTT